jgi:hypothetical protein
VVFLLVPLQAIMLGFILFEMDEFKRGHFVKHVI